MTMLNAFLNWARPLAQQLRGSGVEASVCEGTVTSNPAARLDIDTDQATARVACWDSGDYHAEAMNLATDEVVLSRHGRLTGERAFRVELADFFEAIGIAP